MPVSFEEGKNIQQISASGISGGMSGWLVRKGLAANQTSGDLTLLVLAALCISVGVFLYFHTASGGAMLSGAELNRTIEQMKETTARMVPQAAPSF